MILLAGIGPGAVAGGPTVCASATGSHGGFFYTFWKDGGSACMTLRAGGAYDVRYDLAPGQNLVVGKGWRRGSATRSIGYQAAAFAAGRNSYLALYGWSVDPLVEYYVVDNWGTAFTPPGPDARRIAVIDSDGGTYVVYRTRRVLQPSIRGRRSFDQYWSVRTVRRPIGGRERITFANHVRAWRAHGMPLGRLDYQVIATEGFGSTGASDVTLWDDRGATGVPR